MVMQNIGPRETSCPLGLNTSTHSPWIAFLIAHSFIPPSNRCGSMIFSNLASLGMKRRFIRLYTTATS